MSLRATLWALDQAPVTDSVGALILLALADEAADDGTGACPYKDKLIARARKSERTVQVYLRKLYQDRIIDFGDQTVAQKRYSKAPGHAPRVWDLNLDATWDNVPEPRTEEEMRLYAKMVSGRIAASGVQVSAPRADGVQNPHPDSDQGKRAEGGVQQTAPQEAPEAANASGVQNPHPDSDLRKQTDERRGGVQTSAPFPNTKRRKPSPPPSSTEAPAPSTPDPQEQNPEPSLDLENQETEADVESVDFFPTLTSWEVSLLRECVEINPLWSSRRLRKVIGSRTVREMTSRNPDLVRRAFLIGARDSNTVPMRLWYIDQCPHWKTALAQIRTEAAAASSGDDVPPALDSGPGVPDPIDQVPEQRLAPADTVAPAAPNEALRAEMAALAERNAARREAEEREARERAERLAALFGDAGGGPGCAESTLGDPVLGEPPLGPALEPAGGNMATVR